ncbi:MAG: DUF2156 domain-containing protein [Gammaproteobacteria bacterium]|nr:MAG: DUF2156 domain-containing protein [Gammaproteobacteria bacterium]
MLKLFENDHNPEAVVNLFSSHLNTHQPHKASPGQPCLMVGEHRLHPLTIDSKNLFDDYTRHASFLVADLSFTNNFIWLNRMSGFYQIIEDCFCLFSLNGNRLTMLLPPIGETNRQLRALPVCFEIMDSYNATPSWSMVEYVNSDCAKLFTDDYAIHNAFFNKSNWSLEPGFSDYLYNTQDLIELKGNNYKTKRSEINQFMRAYPNHHVEPLQEKHWPGIYELMNTWLSSRIQNLNGPAISEFIASVELERQGIERALQHFEQLKLKGLCLMIDGRVEGFTFGEEVNASVASILVEKTNFAIPGAAQYLFREFARSFAHCTYINVGDDLGLENMRRVKMSYRPVLFGEKFTLRRAI